MANRAPRLVVLTAGVLLLAGPVAAQDTGQPWIHVEISGQGEDAENVNVNLPLSAAEAMLAMAPENVISEGRLRLAERGVPVSAVRAMWQELMEAGDTEFVTIEEDDETVRVARAGDNIEVRVEHAETGEDRTETVEVQLPIAVVDALLSGDGDTLNIAAAIEQLGGLRGDIVRVNEDDRQIRVWIDESAQP